MRRLLRYRRSRPLRVLVIGLIGLVFIQTCVQWSLLDWSQSLYGLCLDEAEVQLLANMTLVVAKALERLNQTYWLDFDCLKGAITTGRIVPTHSHCDLSRLANDDAINYFHQKLQRDLEGQWDFTYRIPDIKYGRITIQSGRIEVHIYSYIIDKGYMNVCYEEIDEGITYSGHYWHRLWRMGLPKAKFFPLRNASFHNEQLPIPHDPWAVYGLLYEFFHQFSVRRCRS